MSRLLVLGRETDGVGCGEGALHCRVDAAVGAVIGGCEVVQVVLELRLGQAELDAVLRPPRARNRRHDGGKVEFEVFAVVRLPVRVVPQGLFLGVRLDERDLLLRPTGEAEVFESDVVDGEHRGRRTELRAHVADGRTVGERNGCDAGAVELHELADDAVPAQHLRDREHDIRRGDAGRDLAGELEADHLGNEHRDGLAKHGRLRLDAADTPAEHAEPVDHRGVRVGADAGVRVGLNAECSVAGIDLPRHGDPGEVLDVDLVHDAGAGRHHLEVLECGLSPAQELVALAVALVLDLDVSLECVLRTEQVGDDRVVYDEFSGREWVDLGRVATELGDGLAHGREVDDAGDAGEVLHDDAGGGELDLGVRLRGRNPAADRPDVGRGDIGAVLGAQQILEQDLQTERQCVVTTHGVEAVDFIGARTNPQGVLRAETVYCRHDAFFLRWIRRATHRQCHEPSWCSKANATGGDRPETEKTTPKYLDVEIILPLRRRDSSQQPAAQAVVAGADRVGAGCLA